MEEKIISCPLTGCWVSIRLLDEHGVGSAYSGLSYELHDSAGCTHAGKLDSEGYARVEGITCGPVVLSFPDMDKSGDQLYTGLQRRRFFALPITQLQVAAEKETSGPRKPNGETYLAKKRAEHEQAIFYRVEVSDFVTAKAHLPDADNSWKPRPSALLKANSGAAAQQVGVALKPNQHHVLEVKALRALSPLLSRGAEFTALNAYQLAVMSAFVYAPFSKEVDGEYQSAPPPYLQPGSIGNVLREQLPRLIKASQFNTAHYNLLWEEVPYSKRLEVVPYDLDYYQEEAALGRKTPEDVHFFNHVATETQAFIVHSPDVVLISVRGTQEKADALRDLDARQVPYAEGEGQAHRGFYGAFLALKKFATAYLDAFHSNQTIIVCGHSLGGAIALLLAEWLRRDWSSETRLYTYGAPRAGDEAFVAAAKGLVHHRLVNHNDPVPSVPTTWMDAEWRLVLLGAVAYAADASAPGLGLLIGGLVNLHGDDYQHHGEQRHFIPRKANGGSEVAVLWQPGCEAISEQICARYAAQADQLSDMPARQSFLAQIFSAKQHSSDGGYSRSALTTLVRWLAAVQQRDGQLFTAAEANDLQQWLSPLDQQLRDWQFPSYVTFKRAVRNDVRFYGKTEIELLDFYSRGKQAGEAMVSQQRTRLSALQKRLLTQAERRLSMADVFGEHVNHPQLSTLVSDWLALQPVQQAAQLAQAPVSAPNQAATA